MMISKSTILANIGRKCLRKDNFRAPQAVKSIRTLSTVDNKHDIHDYDINDVKHHAKLASVWWNSKGPMKALMSMNQLRVPLIRDGLIGTNKVNHELINTEKVLKGLNILEVGCGGGILTEQLARIHANVVGIDPGEEVLEAAKIHLKETSPDLLDRIDYKRETIQSHSKENFEKYDGVVISEVLEHVPEKLEFLKACVNTLKPGGSIFITTLNKTFLAWFAGILMAENVFKLLPKGTHEHDKFISPEDVQKLLENLNCSTILVNGIFYDFVRDCWLTVPSKTINYVLHAIKNE